MRKNAPIFVAGASGMVGSAIVRRLQSAGFACLLTPSRRELDLRNQAAVFSWLERNRPEAVIIAAAKVGGIYANHTYPAEFIADNLAVVLHCTEGAYRSRVKRLLFLGSSCIYPKHAEQPLREDSLLTGPLEPTNEAYAIAKIAGLKLCQYYRKQFGVVYHSLMPTNLYGPGDNYHPQNSHVLPALIRRLHEAKESGAPEVVVWGSGSPLREFLHVDDLSDAVHFLLQLDDPPDWINVGAGVDLSIRDLAVMVMNVVDYRGKLTFDTSRPDGTPRKLMDVSRLAQLGWKAKIGLLEGITRTYASFLEELKNGTLRDV